MLCVAPPIMTMSGRPSPLMSTTWHPEADMPIGIQNLVPPLSALVVLGVENVRAGDLPFGPIAGDDVVAAVAVEIADADLVAFLQIAEDDLRCQAPLFCV